jgi:two-component system phosphate regulon sensor histidine kinase PhoR
VLLRAAAAISAVPVAAFVVLAATGALAAAPAAIAATLTVAASLGLAAFLERDVLRLRATLGQAVRVEGPVRAELPRLPALASVAPEIRRLTGALAERAAMVERLRDADRAILDRLPDPLILLGPDRAVRRANAAARAAFGDDIAAVLRHPTLRRAIDRALAGRDSQQVDLALNVPVARQLHATVFVLDVPLADGTATIAVLSDRSRERAVERMRADFVANASHELRTPLASVIGFIDTLRGAAADDPPAQARFLGIMAEQAARMNRLIDDLLSLSRIELSEHQPPADDVDLGVLVRRIAAAFEPSVAARRIRFEVTLDPALPHVAGDADQLAQVLQNLLDNAVKYGREGGRVGVTAAPAAPDPRLPPQPGVLIAVSDDGPGIPREHIPRLTERFYRVDTARSRAAGGTGLGLAIVKHIVNRHRGLLLIESREGHGARFEVWLPVGR